MILVGIWWRGGESDIVGVGWVVLRIHDSLTPKDLTTHKAGLKYREIPAKTSLRTCFVGTFRIYDSKVDPSFPKR